MQANEPEREQTAQLGAAFGGSHRRGGERIGATDGTGIEHHDSSVQDFVAPCDLGTGQPTSEAKGGTVSPLRARPLADPICSFYVSALNTS